MRRIKATLGSWVIIGLAFGCSQAPAGVTSGNPAAPGAPRAASQAAPTTPYALLDRKGGGGGGSPGNKGGGGGPSARKSGGGGGGKDTASQLKPPTGGTGKTERGGKEGPFKDIGMGNTGATTGGGGGGGGGCRSGDCGGGGGERRGTERGFDNEHHRWYGNGSDWWGAYNWWSYGNYSPWWGLGVQPAWWGSVPLTTNRLVQVGEFFYPFYQYGAMIFPDYSQPLVNENGMFVAYQGPRPPVPNNGQPLSMYGAMVVSGNVGSI